MIKCQIQWVDRTGTPTPDSNDAIGTVYCEAYVHQMSDGRRVPMDRSGTFYICADHAATLQGPWMHHWVFEPLTGGLSQPQ